jgi:hypothetical protein
MDGSWVLVKTESEMDSPSWFDDDMDAERIQLAEDDSKSHLKMEKLLEGSDIELPLRRSTHTIQNSYERSDKAGSGGAIERQWNG